MLWVIQNDIYLERGYPHLLKALEEFAVPHVVVRLTPVIHKLLDADFDTSLYTGDLDDIPEAVIDDTNGIFVMGSVDLGLLAKSRGWKPGTMLNDNFDWRVWSAQYGEHALNGGGKLMRLDEADFRGEAFVRPALDDKTFNGHVTNRNAFMAWRQLKLRGDNPLERLRPDTPVIVASKRYIHAEFRHFIVDGKVLTSSMYRRNGRQEYRTGAPDEAVNFAERMSAVWEPARAYVLDTAVTQGADGQEQHLVMEPGCINSAGFYHADVRNIVRAIENPEFTNSFALTEQTL